MKKKIINRIILLFTAFAMLSCSEDFINLSPISSASSTNFYKTQADFETAIWAVYRDWHNLYDRMLTEFLELRGDTYTGASYSYVQVSTNNFTDNAMEGPWSSFYKIIADANIVLDRIEGVEFDASVKNRIIGEARFARAEAYFYLIRFFGSVPLVVHEISSKEALTCGRAPMNDILAQIEDDYKFALANVRQNITLSESFGLWHKYAVEGQLARFYITLSGSVYKQNRWADAKPLLEDILNNSPFGFAPTFEEIFADDGSGEKSEEVILSVVYKAGSGNISHAPYPEQFNIFGQCNATLEPGVIESFEDGDIRKDISVAPGGNNLNGQYIDKKCNVKFDWGYDAATNTSGMDSYVLRYTDVQLMYAEMLAEIAGSVPEQALELFNRSRVRAGLKALTPADVPDIAAFRLAMEKERRSELMFECVRWFDLVRTGRAVDALRAIGKNADETWLLFPIPQSEIDKVGKEVLPQNPGYPGA
ncbi:MAG: RagB/SusD family nutrient uptake outer membrane protein [Tannerella sp.]|jgi:hypothetical protein|nr:RagB/SusD family nutrient uptake outer membrane protein [Tannerella sp.]